MVQEALLLIHPTFGVLAAMGALWVLAEVVRFDPAGFWRIKTASILVAGFLVATWLAGGLWDSYYFDVERDFVEKGSWAFYGNTGMEMKEHLFSIIMVLGLYVPIAVHGGNLATDRGARIVVGVSSTLVVLGALAMEGAGAVLGLSVKIGTIMMMPSGSM